MAGRTLGATKSGVGGLDFEYTKRDTRYLVAVKSGKSWGNQDQWDALERNVKRAISVLKQSPHVKNVECILGISYGRSKSTIRRGVIRQIHGQTFWYLISGQKSFYKTIVEPIGHRAPEFNEAFFKKKAELINVFTAKFMNEFCDSKGRIQWGKLVEFNSGNLTAAEEKRWQ